MAPATGHSRRMCRILHSEWWQQVRFFRDCLRIACSRQPQQPGTNHRFQDWSWTSIQLTEFLWNQVRPNLPLKKKQRIKEGTVLVLGDRPVAEQHRQILKLGPKFCFEPALKRVDKLALSRLVSRQVPEEDKPSYSPLRRAERAAELSKADLPQRWHPENRAMAIAGGTTSCPASASPSGTKCTRGSHCKHMKGGHCDLEAKLVHLSVRSPEWMSIGTDDLMKVKRSWI
ncbi:hypothetical protein HPB47_017843 [Ixodes persulcatus]|uniref:Uncharacterized protein n=1 Tax=Ixodes persulcatus TaxID=34615 RepID=A0AC60QM94_IXOPE|nr:hypothetical protein HPB47_017843 [Ixodes persulcatus]